MMDRHEILLKCSLEALTEVCPFLEGISLEACSPFDSISIRTVNSEYRLLLLDPKSGRVLLEGGTRFMEPVEVTILGSSFGGSMLRLGWLGVGLRIEICTNDKYVVTSPVQLLSIEHNPVPTELTSDLCQ